MTIPKPVTFTQLASAGYKGPDPEAFVIIGDVPGAGGESGPIAIADVTGLDAALTGKAAASHTHTIANVTGLQAAIDGKAASSHAHTATQVTATAIGPGAATTVQGILAELAARITALETP